MVYFVFLHPPLPLLPPKSYITPPSAPPSPKWAGCPVAQRACLTWYFTDWAPVRVRACVWGHQQSHSVWLGVIQLLWPCAALNHSLSRGVSSWFVSAPYLTQWGSRLIRSPAQSLPSGVRIFWFTLANCTSSPVSKQERNLFWAYIFNTAELSVLCLSCLSPGILDFPSKWIRETEIRGVL